MTAPETVTLRAYLEQRIDAVLREMVLREASSKDAIAKAGAATDRRFELVNEFRASLADNERLYLTRTEYDRAHSSLIEKIEALTLRLNEYESRNRGVKLGWGIFAAVLGVAVSAVTVVTLILHMRTTP